MASSVGFMTRFTTRNLDTCIFQGRWVVVTAIAHHGFTIIEVEGDDMEIFAAGIVTYDPPGASIRDESAIAVFMHGIGAFREDGNPIETLEYADETHGGVTQFSVAP